MADKCPKCGEDLGTILTSCTLCGWHERVDSDDCSSCEMVAELRRQLADAINEKATIAQDKRGVEQALEAAQARIAELEAVVAKMQKTADGVRVMPFVDDVFRPYEDGPGDWYWTTRAESFEVVWCHINGSISYDPECCYSTRALAEAARSKT